MISTTISLEALEQQVRDALEADLAWLLGTGWRDEVAHQRPHPEQRRLFRCGQRGTFSAPAAAPEGAPTMKRQSVLASLVMGLSLGMAIGPAAAGDVNVNIGAPAVVVAPPMITTQPQLVVVPGSAVYTAHALEHRHRARIFVAQALGDLAIDAPVFLFGGKYWSHHNDVWFVTSRPGARWTKVAVTAVPHEVRGVPVTYYKVKPKHAKGMKHDADHKGKGGKNR